MQTIFLIRLRAKAVILRFVPRSAALDGRAWLSARWSQGAENPERQSPGWIEQIEAFDTRQIPRHQPLADVAAVSNIWNEDTVGEPIGPLLRRGDALADARRHHRPTVDAARHQFSVFKTDLTVMQVSTILIRELAVEKDRQTDRLFHLGTGVWKRRRREDDAHGEAGKGFEGSH